MMKREGTREKLRIQIFSKINKLPLLIKKNIKNVKIIQIHCKNIYPTWSSLKYHYIWLWTSSTKTEPSRESMITDKTN